jgi:hypothetical protein
LREVETSCKRADASLLSLAEPAVKPIRVVAPALRGCPIGGNEATRVAGLLTGFAILGAAGTAFGGTTFSAAGGGSVTVLTGFLAAAGGLESAGASGLVGTGVRVGAEILGNGGAGITFGRVGAVGGAIGRICRGARFTAGACRAVRVNFRTGFRAVRFFLVVRFRIDLGGRSLIVPDLVEDRPPENTGNFGIGAAYVPPGTAAVPGIPSRSCGTVGDRPRLSITL